MGPDATDLLLGWLRDTDAPSGLIERAPATIREGNLGGIAEILTVTLSGGVTTAALVRALTNWLKYRRPDLNVTITRVGKNGEKSVITIKGNRLDADTPRQIIQELSRPIDPPQ
ncbi:hypothetical protein ACIA5E_18130 [Nocardia asteroides]|uniref:effector-associated constant component EACC1 n=1 Tax=Nocardia asteroides TaxID=1824 RepID=UPI0037A8B5C2